MGWCRVGREGKRWEGEIPGFGVLVWCVEMHVGAV